MVEGVLTRKIMSTKMTIIDFHEEALEIYNSVDIDEMDASEALYQLQDLYKKAHDAGLDVGTVPTAMDVVAMFPNSRVYDEDSYEESYD